MWLWDAAVQIHWIVVLGSRRKNEQEGKQLTENKPRLGKQMKVTKG